MPHKTEPQLALHVIPELGSSLRLISQDSLPWEQIVFIARVKEVNFKRERGSGERNVSQSKKPCWLRLGLVLFDLGLMVGIWRLAEIHLLDPRVGYNPDTYQA